MKALRLALLLLLLLLAPAVAGVVEDAEDSLQTVSSDNPARRPLEGLPGNSQESVSSALSDPSGGATSSGSSGSSSASRPDTTSSSAPSGGLSNPSLPDAQETPLVDEVVQERNRRERSDNLMSLAGILLLLLLVVAAGLYSRRAGPED